MTPRGSSPLGSAAIAYPGQTCALSSCSYIVSCRFAEVGGRGIHVKWKLLNVYTLKVLVGFQFICYLCVDCYKYMVYGIQFVFGTIEIGLYIVVYCIRISVCTTDRTMGRGN